jgi:hypothetical protein
LPGGFSGWLCPKRGKDAGRSQGPRSGIRRIDLDFPIPDRMVNPALFCDQAGNRLLVTRTFRLPSSCSGRVRDPPELEGDHSPRPRFRQPTLAMHRPASSCSVLLRAGPRPASSLPKTLRAYACPGQALPSPKAIGLDTTSFLTLESLVSSRPTQNPAVSSVTAVVQCFNSYPLLLAQSLYAASHSALAASASTSSTSPRWTDFS